MKDVAIFVNITGQAINGGGETIFSFDCRGDMYIEIFKHPLIKSEWVINE
jgi:hypothetical protein